MHYLIDGHNLIGRLPDIQLSDADDEIRLVLRLKGWVAEQPQRQVTVVFDGGVTGGISHRLSTKAITVVFAPPGKTADDLLIQRLSSLRNPANYMLVSSDRRILDAARVARIKHLKSEEFIAQMGFVFREPEETPAPAAAPPTPAMPEKSERPLLSEAELNEWLALFGPAPQTTKRPRGSYSVLRRQAEPEEPQQLRRPEPPKRPRTRAEYAAMAESDSPELDEVEVAAWLALFGAAASAAEKQRPSAPLPGQSHSVRKKQKGDGRLVTMKSAPRKLSREEVEDWLQLFGGEE